jgi:hypothetical protein
MPQHYIYAIDPGVWPFFSICQFAFLLYFLASIIIQADLQAQEIITDYRGSLNYTVF